VFHTESIKKLIAHKPQMRFVISVIFENMAVFKKHDHGLGGIGVVGR
jgi:hypothetical protein